MWRLFPLGEPERVRTALNQITARPLPRSLVSVSAAAHVSGLAQALRSSMSNFFPSSYDISATNMPKPSRRLAQPPHSSARTFAGCSRTAPAAQTQLAALRGGDERSPPAATAAPTSTLPNCYTAASGSQEQPPASRHGGAEHTHGAGARYCPLSPSPLLPGPLRGQSHAAAPDGPCPPGPSLP